MRNIARRWLPLLTIVAALLVAQKALFESRYDVSGHAGEHLVSATAPFAGFAAVALIFFATPRARRQPVVLGAAALWLATTVLVLVGNVRVVDALVRAGMSDTPTSQLVQTPAIESAHGLANLAPWLGVVAAIALAVVLWRYEHVTRRVAIASAVLSALFPPWIIPGAGVIVLTASRWFAASRREPEGARVDPVPVRPAVAPGG